MPIPAWRFMLSDVQGNVLGELTNASNRQIVLPLNRIPTASFQIPLQHTLAHYFTDQTFEGLLRCYRNSTLVFHGPIVSGQAQSDSQLGQSVSVNAAGALWRLQYRFLGTSQAGYVSSAGADSTHAQQPYGTIVQNMLNYVNNAPNNFQGYTGITGGTFSAAGSGSAGPYWFKDVASAVAELSSGLNTFDFEVAPTEPVALGKLLPQIGLLNVVPLLGTSKPNAVFEYGTTMANVTSYSNSLTRDKMMNLGYIQQPGVSDYSGILSASDGGSITARGIFEGLADDNGVEWDQLRTILLNANIHYRKVPRQIVTFAPAPNAAPQPIVDYIVGDQVRARIVVDGQTRLDGVMRIWGITFDLDPNGNETPTLELLQP